MYKIFSKLYDKFMKYSDYSAWQKEIEDLIKAGNPNGKRLLDIGCGTGELLIRMADNYECDGMDLSEDMLKVAHKKLKKKNVNLFLGDMVEFDTGEKYDIMIAIFDTVNHILSIEELISHFNCVRESLNDGGIYIFDVVDREFMKEMFPNDVFYDDRDDLTLIWEHDIEEGIDYIDAIYFLKNKRGSWDKFQETYTKKIFSSDDIKKCIESSKLKLIKTKINDKIAGNRELYLLKK